MNDNEEDASDNEIVVPQVQISEVLLSPHTPTKSSQYVHQHFDNRSKEEQLLKSPRIILYF